MNLGKVHNVIVISACPITLNGKQSGISRQVLLSLYFSLWYTMFFHRQNVNNTFSECCRACDFLCKIENNWVVNIFSNLQPLGMYIIFKLLF